MIEVKVLGVGCANCKTTQDLIEKVCDDNDIAINLEKIEDQVKIMEYGIMSTPDFSPLGDFLNPVLALLGQDLKKSPIGQKLDFASHPYLCKGLYKFFNIQSMDVAFSNGEKRQYERLKPDGDGAVLVVPMLDDDTVLMIYEYSGGTHRYELALTKGKIDAGESPLEAANRELIEEIGYGAKKLSFVKTMTLAPHYRDLCINRSNHQKPTFPHLAIF
jgi:ADP-ribose diphosphatase